VISVSERSLTRNSSTVSSCSTIRFRSLAALAAPSMRGARHVNVLARGEDAFLEGAGTVGLLP